jgi:hypothetical protein
MTSYEDDMDVLSEAFEGVLVNENKSNAFKAKARQAVRQVKPDADKEGIEKAAMAAWQKVKAGSSEDEVINQILQSGSQEQASQPQSQPEEPVQAETPEETTQPEESTQGIIGRGADKLAGGIQNLGKKADENLQNLNYNIKTSFAGAGGHNTRKAKKLVKNITKRLGKIKSKAVSDITVIDDLISDVGIVSNRLSEIFSQEKEGQARHTPHIQALEKVKAEAERVKSLLDQVSTGPSTVTENARQNIELMKATVLVEMKALKEEFDKEISTF